MNGSFTVPQSAVVAYRTVSNRPEVLLVTSRTRGRWVLPKGMITAGMTPAESAVKEAWEEAGVVGTVSGGCLGVYRYIKTRRCGVRSCAVKVYAMKVTAVLPTWPEQRMRKRRWMGIDEAICRVMDRDLKRLLIMFRAKLRSHAMAFRTASSQVGGGPCCSARDGFGHDATGVAARSRACRVLGQEQLGAGTERGWLPASRPMAATRRCMIRADRRLPSGDGR